MRGADFKKGNRVYHIGRKETGIVTSVVNGTVIVEFGRSRASGGRSIGEFNDLWFDMHPNWLIDAKQALPTDTGSVT